ncbi:cytochrome P450 [Gordonia crocea]|uniref:Cytochrome P450 n=1 Tax=Gordonia crocea TaxID=589162 RepID=A0A7M3SUB8_9ACTN|nr:cytochrome P450 [Gordonia crocea]GED96242.1 cytochrome P450 [Gordonia crocea]
MTATCPFHLPASQNTVHAEELKATYAQMRESSPTDVVRVDFPFGGEGWMSLGYERARAILGDPRFSIEKMSELDDYPRIREIEKGAPPSFLQYDGRKHTTKRRILMKNLTAKRVHALKPLTQEIIDAAFDEFEAAGNPAEITHAVGRMVPLKVLSALMGAPVIEDPAFLDASYLLVDSRAMSPEEAMSSALVLFGFFNEMYEEKRANPGDDLLSALIHDTEAGEWTEEELRAVGFTLLAAGHDATATMLNGIMEWLSYEPELFERLRTDEEVFPRALEEMFRCITVGIGIPRGRIALEDVWLDDVLIKEGDAIGGNLLAAHGDPEVYPNPDELDIDRESPRPHLAFGFGQHACAGASLARMEITAVLKTLLARYRTFTNVTPRQDWRSRRLLKGPTELTVAWTRA